MSTNVHTPLPPPAASAHHQQQLRADAHRWVRRLRTLYTILGIYAALSVMWLLIDLSDGTENLWFYWPMFGVGVAVAIASVVLVGVGGVFGTDWERRQVERYVERQQVLGGEQVR